MLTLDTFKTLFPKAKTPEKFVDAINKNLEAYEINTTERLAAFLAQAGHECAHFTKFKESTYYSNPDWIEKVFGPHRRHGYSGEQLKRNPELLANVVYSNMLGNGDIESGDGYDYRGRGIFQLTGKCNYEDLARDLCIDCVKKPNMVSADIDTCVLSAFWYWKKNNLNRFVDRRDFKGLTRAINGGLHGIKDREEICAKAMKLLK